MTIQRQKLLEEYISIMLQASKIGTELFGISLQDKVATVLQMQALRYLYNHPRTTVGELAKIFSMSSPSTAQFTRRLEKAGYILKEREARDHRTILLSLTPKGKKEAQTLPAIIQENGDKIFSLISEEDMKTLIHILTKMIHTKEEQKR